MVRASVIYLPFWIRGCSCTIHVSISLSTETPSHSITIAVSLMSTSLRLVPISSLLPFLSGFPPGNCFAPAVFLHLAFFPAIETCYILFSSFSFGLIFSSNTRCPTTGPGIHDMPRRSRFNNSSLRHHLTCLLHHFIHEGLGFTPILMDQTKHSPTFVIGQ